MTRNEIGPTPFWFGLGSKWFVCGLARFGNISEGMRLTGMVSLDGDKSGVNIPLDPLPQSDPVPLWYPSDWLWNISGGSNLNCVRLLCSDLIKRWKFLEKNSSKKLGTMLDFSKCYGQYHLRFLLNLSFVSQLSEYNSRIWWRATEHKILYTWKFPYQLQVIHRFHCNIKICI